MTTIGERLQEARESLYPSQRAAAKAYGGAETNVNMWEKDRTVPAEYVGWLSEKTGYSPTYLLLGHLPKIDRDPKEASKKLDWIQAVLDNDIEALEGSMPSDVVAKILAPLRRDAPLPAEETEKKAARSRRAGGHGRG